MPFADLSINHDASFSCPVSASVSRRCCWLMCRPHTMRIDLRCAKLLAGLEPGPCAHICSVPTSNRFPTYTTFNLGSHLNTEPNRLLSTLIIPTRAGMIACSHGGRFHEAGVLMLYFTFLDSRVGKIHPFCDNSTVFSLK